MRWKCWHLDSERSKKTLFFLRNVLGKKRCIFCVTFWGKTLYFLRNVLGKNAVFSAWRFGKKCCIFCVTFWEKNTVFSAWRFGKKRCIFCVTFWQKTWSWRYVKIMPRSGLHTADCVDKLEILLYREQIFS